MEVCQVLPRAISEMYIRGRVSVTYVTCNGLVALWIGIYTSVKSVTLVRECQLDGRPEVDGYNVPMAQF